MNFVKLPIPKDSQKSLKKELNEKKVDNYDEKMKKLQRNNSNSSKSSLLKNKQINDEKNNDSFIDAEINDNQYEKLFNRINEKKISNKEYNTKNIKTEVKRKYINESIEINNNENVITKEKQLNIQPNNKNNSVLFSKEASYDKEQFYEISHLNNFTISHNFASNDFRENSNIKNLKIANEENLNVKSNSKNNIIEKPRFETKQSSIEESKNMIDMSEVVKNSTIDKKIEMEGEDDYKFDDYNNTNTINSKEEIIEEKYSAIKTSPVRKSLSLRNKSSSIKDLIDEEFSISENNRKNNYIKCYICQCNVLKSEAVNHAENCKNIILSSIQESNVQSEVNVFNQDDSEIKENIS